MDIDPYLLAVVLGILLIGALAVGLRGIRNALRPRPKEPVPSRRSVPTASDYYARTLRQAAEVVGSEEDLATVLNVPPDALHRWLEGEESPPIEIHLAALDLVTRRAGRPPRRRNARTP